MLTVDRVLIVRRTSERSAGDMALLVRRLTEMRARLGEPVFLWIIVPPEFRPPREAQERANVQRGAGVLLAQCAAIDVILEGRSTASVVLKAALRALIFMTGMQGRVHLSASIEQAHARVREHLRRDPDALLSLVRARGLISTPSTGQ